VIAFIDEHRDDYGFEPTCWVLPIAPSTNHKHSAQQRDTSRLSSLAQRDWALKPEVMRGFAENFGIYGVRKVWRRMRDLGLLGVVRGKPVRTTVSDKTVRCPFDQVNRQFHAPAPNMLCVSDFAYVAPRFSHCRHSWTPRIIIRPDLTRPKGKQGHGGTW
jgi:hypothetical protein